MLSKIGSLLSSIKFGVIIVLFMMPFITVSCSNSKMLSFTGMDMVTGKKMEFNDPFTGKTARKEKLEPEMHTIIAFGCAVAGLLFSFATIKAARFLNVISGACGGIMLILLKNRVDEQIIKEGYGMFTVQYEVAYWISLILFFVAAIVNIFFATFISEKKT